MTSVLSNSSFKNSNNLAYNNTSNNRKSNKQLTIDSNNPAAQHKQRTKLIVDKDGHTTMEGIHESIVQAL